MRRQLIKDYEGAVKINEDIIRSSNGKWTEEKLFQCEDMIHKRLNVSFF